MEATGHIGRGGSKRIEAGGGGGGGGGSGLVLNHVLGDYIFIVHMHCIVSFQIHFLFWR